MVDIFLDLDFGSQYERMKFIWVTTIGKAGISWRFITEIGIAGQLWE